MRASVNYDRDDFPKAPHRTVGQLQSLPQRVVQYLAHTTGQIPLRELARAQNRHASTVLRQIRKVESERDDPLNDEGLEWAGTVFSACIESEFSLKELAQMVAGVAKQHVEIDPRVEKEAKRILRRLSEKGAFLAVAQDMAKAVVMRETTPGTQTRIAVVDRAVAHQFALQDWISCSSSGRVAKYEITQVGRATLKRILAEDQSERQSRYELAEAPSPFRAQHQEDAERLVMDDDSRKVRKIRTNLAESPLALLGRKRDRAGTPYLTPALIEAGERLREDFELAQMSPRITQNWEAFLTPSDKGQVPGGGPASGPTAARNRVSDALSAMGPGLSDIVFRVCCFLEGLEAAERRMGWSARSGKVVLRIALQRLADHYGLR